MKIAIIGYGKMGKIIERIAIEAGHQIVLKINSKNKIDLTRSNLKKADVAIEFSRPDFAFDNIAYCLKSNIPVVSGTTGWIDQIEEIKSLSEQNSGAFFYASNFSIGVNIFFEVNRFLAKSMNGFPDYKISLEEIHHTEKLDQPSGTAISLAQDIIAGSDRKTKWVNQSSSSPNELSIISKRIDQVPGTHKVTYQSSIDSLEIQHTAHSREGFAKGALMAAQWLVGKKGVFGMKDLLGF